MSIPKRRLNVSDTLEAQLAANKDVGARVRLLADDGDFGRGNFDAGEVALGVEE